MKTDKDWDRLSTKGPRYTDTGTLEDKLRLQHPGIVAKDADISYFNGNEEDMNKTYAGLDFLRKKHKDNPEMLRSINLLERKYRTRYHEQRYISTPNLAKKTANRTTVTPKENPERQSLTSYIADKLIQAREAGNKYKIIDEVPLLGGTGVGDFWLGEAPEMSKDLDKEGPSAMFTPEYAAKQQRMGPMGALDYVDSRMLDLAFLGMDVGGLAALPKMVSRGSRKAIDKFKSAIQGETNTSRRDFLKKGAAVAAATAVGVGALKTASKIGKETVTTPKGWDNVEGGAYKFHNLKEYLDDVEKRASNEIDNRWDEYSKDFGSPEDFVDWKAHETDIVKKRILKSDEAKYWLDKNGLGFADEASSVNNFSPLAKQQMKNLKNNISPYSESWTDEVIFGPIP